MGVFHQCFKSNILGKMKLFCGSLTVTIFKSAEIHTKFSLNYVNGKSEKKIGTKNS
jgi:hypothetical protein